MVTIVSWNINGIRGKSMDLIRDGQFNKESNLFKLMTEYLPDVICFSETKCQEKNLGTLKWPINEQQQEMYPYRTFNCSSIKKGYSGVGVISKIPWLVNHGSIPTLEDDHEGRSLVLEYDKFMLVTVYTPNSGTKSEYRQIWDINVRDYLSTLTDIEKPVIYCGDLNVVHKEIDIYDPKIWQQEKHAGVLDYEKIGIQNILDIGYVDSWRHFHPDTPKYSWWNPRVKARQRGIGWRIDYMLVREKDMEKVSHTDILNDIMGSDHCPVLLTLDI